MFDQKHNTQANFFFVIYITLVTLVRWKHLINASNLLRSDPHCLFSTPRPLSCEVLFFWSFFYQLEFDNLNITDLVYHIRDLRIQNMDNSKLLCFTAISPFLVIFSASLLPSSQSAILPRSASDWRNEGPTGNKMEGTLAANSNFFSSADLETLPDILPASSNLGPAGLVAKRPGLWHQLHVASGDQLRRVKKTGNPERRRWIQVMLWLE